MNDRAACLSLLVVSGIMFTSATSVAADDAEVPGTARTIEAVHAPRLPEPWLVRVETGFVGMRDASFGIPKPETGVTLARDLTPRFSVEMTGAVRELGSDDQRSWSLLAVGRWAVLQSASGHALTIAGGPFLELDNPVHGTIPLAHTELAYVYRAPWGMSFLVGAGVNVALASSPYVKPPSRCPRESVGDAFVFCLDLGPPAAELHAGDPDIHLRMAAGWRF